MSDVKIPQTAVGAFKAFLTAFNEGKSYVLNEVKEDLFSKENLEGAYKLYKDNSQSENSGKKIDKKFDEVIKVIQDKKNSQEIIHIINHAVWLWSLPNNRKAQWIIEKDIYNKDLLGIKGVAGGGSGYVQKKTNGVRYVLYLLNSLVKETSDRKQRLISLLKKDKYDNDTYQTPDGVKNLLLHLCSPDAYEPIASTDDKKKIVSTFWMNIDKEGPKSKTEAIGQLDETIKKIRTTLGLDNASFYDNSLPLLWKHEKGTELSLVQKLEYKKAMILYGPPGTSKTYTAKELATSVIFRHIMRHDKGTALNIIKNNLLGELKKRIKVLQFHINLNYEDFIAGHTIEGNNVKTKKGVIYDIIEESKKTSMSVSDTKIGFSIDETNETTNDKNAKLPYVVILDEINRTDISRVFGELFSAIENRGEDIDLLLPPPDNQNQCKYLRLKLNQKHNLKLNIPENIYFIGTMNEIDFSLERVDFALRRRFIWELHDFDKETLSEIIEFRLGDYADDADDIFQEDKDDFCAKCVALNKKIEDVMGETYHLGHAFFADIANIYNKLKENGMSGCWNKAKDILWEISIKPTLDAYCGTMNSGLKEKYLGNKGEFRTAFFGNTKENGDIENQ